MVFLKEMIREHFNVLALFFLFGILMLAHTAMIHWGRAEIRLEWAENMISQTFAALLGYLAGKSVATAAK